MPSTQELPAVEGAPELLWIGDGAWVARDLALPQDDPRRVIAYLECKDHLVYLLWAQGLRDVRCFASIREALVEMAASMVRVTPRNVAPQPQTG